MQIRKYILILSLAGFAACGGNEQQPELISFEELAGETGSDSVLQMDHQSELNNYPLKVQNFILSQLTTHDTLSTKAPHPIDRFGYSSVVKLDFAASGNSSEASENFTKKFVYYSFSDTLKTKNAFYNWLDCFGQSCESVQLNKDLENMNTGQSLALIYDTTIVSVIYPCELSKGDRKSFQDSLLSKFGKNYLYRIETECSGALKWK